MSDERGLLETLRTELSPGQFEDFIAELWTYQGWQTQRTANSSDKGIDVVATREYPYNQKSLIQAKRYAEGTKVSSPEIQKYASLKQRDDVDTVVIVTTSSFTEQAKSIADEFNLKLIAGERLADLIRREGAEELVESSLTGSPSDPLAHSENNESSFEDTTGKKKTAEETTSAEGDRLSMELVALAKGRSVNKYLNREITDIEDQMSVLGDRTYENKISAFIIVTNAGEKIRARKKHFVFETDDGYQYSVDDEGFLLSGLGATLKGKWKATGWEIAHNQTQYWTILTESIPDNTTLDRMIFENDDERIRIQFGHLRDRLYDNNPLKHD